MPMFFRPGNQLKAFEAFRDTAHVSPTGRPSNTGPPESIGAFNATLADATPAEIDRWKQVDHTITHQIVQRGTSKARSGDYLVYAGRKFYIEGIDNPGEIGFFTIYFVNEKEGKG